MAYWKEKTWKTFQEDMSGIDKKEFPERWRKTKGKAKFSYELSMNPGC